MSAPVHKSLIDAVGVDTIVCMLSRGMLQTEVAAAIGVPHDAISRYARQHPGYDDAIAAHHTARLDEVERLHEQAIAARDFDLARAREAQFKLRRDRAAVASAAHREPRGNEHQSAPSGPLISITLAPGSSVVAGGGIEQVPQVIDIKQITDGE